MTICAKCKYYTKLGLSVIFCNEVCEAPKVQFKPVMSFVTGEMSEPVSPSCRSINTDGNCPHFEEGKSIIIPPTGFAGKEEIK